MPILNWQLFNNPVYDATSAYFFDLNRTNITAASFSTIAQGGFGDANIEIDEPPARLIQMALDTFLMKRVAVFDGAGRMAYEGFIAEIDATLDNQRFIRSMDTFANRVYVNHKYKNGQGTPCAKGATCIGRQTVDEDDVATTQTQTEWGIKTATLDLNPQGHITIADATDVGELYLRSSLRASAVDFQQNVDEPQPNHISLGIWGYYATLQWNYQTRSYRTATEIATIVKGGLTAITVGGGGLTSSPQFISTDHSDIATTGRTIKYNIQRKWMTFMDYIQGALVEGNSDARRLFFQILENRRPYLFARPAAARYYVTNGLDRVWNEQHTVIPPYMMRAGGYIATENFNESFDPISDIRTRRHVSHVDRTFYDDMTGRLSIPPPENIISPERLLARVWRGTKKHLY